MKDRSQQPPSANGAAPAPGLSRRPPMDTGGMLPPPSNDNSGLQSGQQTATASQQDFGNWLNDYRTPGQQDGVASGFTGTQNGRNYINGNPYAAEYMSQGTDPNTPDFAFSNILRQYQPQIAQMGSATPGGLPQSNPMDFGANPSAPNTDPNSRTSGFLKGGLQSGMVSPSMPPGMPPSMPPSMPPGTPDGSNPALRSNSMGLNGNMQSIGNGVAPSMGQGMPGGNPAGRGSGPGNLNPPGNPAFDALGLANFGLSAAGNNPAARVMAGTGNMPSQSGTGGPDMSQQPGTNTTGGQPTNTSTQTNTPSADNPWSSLSALFGNVMQQAQGAGDVTRQVANAGSIQDGIQRYGSIQNQLNLQGLPDYQRGANYGQIQGQVNTSGVPGLVGGDALSGAMHDAQQAAYQGATGYLDPQWNNQQNQLQTQLANQGVMQNSEAWNKAMDDFNRQKTFAYQQAQSNAVQQGNAAQAQLFGQGLASNQNAFGQALQGGQFANTAQAQDAGQQQFNATLGNQARSTQAQELMQSMGLGNAAQQQGFNQNLASGQFSNASQAQRFGQNLSQADLANAAQNQQFGQNMSQAQLYNQGQSQLAQQLLATRGLAQGQAQNDFNNSMTMRNQDLNELLMQQQNPLQMLNALLGGQQVQPPNFAQTPGSTMGGTDISSIINNVMGQRNSQYNAQVGAQNSQTAGEAAVAAALIAAMF